MSTTPAKEAAGGDLQPSKLIVSIYGLYARAEPHWLSVASLVRMMGALGVDGPAVRATVSRLKRRGTLVSRRADGAAGYALSETALEILREGDQRIFGQRRARREEGWVLLTFSVPEKERDRRHELRTQLIRLGFGTVASGVWIAPAHLAPDTREILARHGLERYVDMFSAHHFAFAEPARKVEQWWDLELISAQNAEFIERYRPLARRWRHTAGTDEAAFAEYVPMLTWWRRLPYLDPGLPLDVLPRGWKGLAAGELFGELDGYLAEPARRHALTLIRS